MTFTPGQTGHTAEHNSIRDDLDGRLSNTQLEAKFAMIPSGGTDGQALIKTPTGLAWGDAGYDGGSF